MDLNVVSQQPRWGRDFHETSSIQPADVLDVNRPAQFVDAMIVVGVVFLHKFFFMEVPVGYIVNVIFFSPLNVILHHNLDVG